MKNTYLCILIILGLCTSPVIIAQNINLKVVGASDFETKIIDSIGYNKSFEAYDGITKEMDTLVKRIGKLGFYYSSISSNEQLNDSTYNIALNLGERFKTLRIYFDGISEREQINDLLKLDRDDFFEIDIKDLEKTLSFLISEIASAGDPFFTLSLSNITKAENSLLLAHLESKNNLKRSLDKIIVKGYDKFPKSFVEHYLKLKPGQTFNLNKIKKRSRQLSNLIYAKQQREPELLFTKDSTILYVYVEKVPSNNFDGFLGFGTNEITQKLQLDGYLNLELLNNLNYGESLRLYYKSDESDQKTIDINVEMPYLLNSPLGLEGGLNIFKRDSSFLTTTQNYNLVYQFNYNNSLSAGIQSIKSDLLTTNANSLQSDYNSVFYEIGYRSATSDFDNFLFPVQFKFNLQTAIGTRQIQNTKTDQTKISLETFKIFNFNTENSLFGRITGGYLISEDYLPNELFRFGGINSIRGFKENTLEANLFSVLNTEYRYLVNTNLYVHTVLDFAYLENKITEMKDKLLGFGFGFGLLTNTGLLKFNYSGSKVNNNKVSLSDFKIHISLNARF